MLSCIQSQHSILKVVRMGRCHIDDINIRISDKICVRAVRFCVESAIDSLQEGFGSFRITRRSDCHDFVLDVCDTSTLGVCQKIFAEHLSLLAASIEEESCLFTHFLQSSP
jgi:hypothetical protein